MQRRIIRRTNLKTVNVVRGRAGSASIETVNGPTPEARVADPSLFPWYQMNGATPAVRGVLNLHCPDMIDFMAWLVWLAYGGEAPGVRATFEINRDNDYADYESINGTRHRVVVASRITADVAVPYRNGFVKAGFLWQERCTHPSGAPLPYFNEFMATVSDPRRVDLLIYNFQLPTSDQAGGYVLLTLATE